MSGRTFEEEERLIQEQLDQGMSQRQIARALNMNRRAVQRRIASAKKRASLDPELLRRLTEKGLTDLGSLHSGWLLDKDKYGSGSSLYFMIGDTDEKISFADAVIESLDDIPRLLPISLVPGREHADADLANWIALADLHIGGHYGDPKNEEEFNQAFDDVVTRLPRASHAVLIELGDLLEANDHKGVTPNSGNPLDVIKHQHLTNTRVAIRLMRRAVYRLLETHQTVEVHFIKGNHDPTAYMAVALALQAHFELNDRVTFVITEDEYRVISWGECAAFPHHGDTLNWAGLKDVWADQFADAWAAAKMHRIIMTAHFHHGKKQELVGCIAEQFQTLHRPNIWAKTKGLFSRGTLTAMTVHKSWGEIGRITSNLRNTYRGH
jgi:transcriptional regulator with XRE-family HTH domain